MEILSLGKTDLPLEIILEYLESLKAIYTAEVLFYQHDWLYDRNRLTIEQVL